MQKLTGLDRAKRDFLLMVELLTLCGVAMPIYMGQEYCGTCRGTEKSFNSIEEKRFYTRARWMEYAKRGWVYLTVRSRFEMSGICVTLSKLMVWVRTRSSEKAYHEACPGFRAYRVDSRELEDSSKAARRYGPNDLRRQRNLRNASGSRRNKPGTVASTRGGIKLSAAVETF